MKITVKARDAWALLAMLAANVIGLILIMVSVSMLISSGQGASYLTAAGLIPLGIGNTLGALLLSSVILGMLSARLSVRERPEVQDPQD